MTATRISIAVVQRDQEFLIGKRPEGSALAGLWEFPGGKIESGETPEQAAVRECREETGVEVEVIGQYPQRDHQYQYGRVQLHFFSCRPLNPKQTPRQPFQWVPGEHLPQYQFPDGNRDLLKTLTQQQ